MTIVKFSPQNHGYERFVLIPTRLAQATTWLSLEALGMATYLASLPPAWEVRPGHLARAWGIGRDRIRRLFKELEDYGILVRRCHQDGRGRWVWSTRVDVTKVRLTPPGDPGDGKTVDGFPVDGAPVDGESAHIEMKNNKKINIKTKKTTTADCGGSGLREGEGEGEDMASVDQLWQALAAAGLHGQRAQKVIDEYCGQVTAGVAKFPKRLLNHLIIMENIGKLEQTSWGRSAREARERQQAVARAHEKYERRRQASIAAATANAAAAAPLPAAGADLDLAFGAIRAALRGGSSLAGILPDPDNA